MIRGHQIEFEAWIAFHLTTINLYVQERERERERERETERERATVIVLQEISN